MPLVRTPPPMTAQIARFESSLPTRARLQRLGSLGHDLVVAGPSGVIHDITTVVAPQTAAPASPVKTSGAAPQLPLRPAASSNIRDGAPRTVARWSSAGPSLEPTVVAPSVAGASVSGRAWLVAAELPLPGAAMPEDLAYRPLAAVSDPAVSYPATASASGTELSLPRLELPVATEQARGFAGPSPGEAGEGVNVASTAEPSADTGAPGAVQQLLGVAHEVGSEPRFTAPPHDEALGVGPVLREPPRAVPSTGGPVSGGAASGEPSVVGPLGGMRASSGPGIAGSPAGGSLAAGPRPVSRGFPTTSAAAPIQRFTPTPDEPSAGGPVTASVHAPGVLPPPAIPRHVHPAPVPAPTPRRVQRLRLGEALPQPSPVPPIADLGGRTESLIVGRSATPRPGGGAREDGPGGHAFPPLPVNGRHADTEATLLHSAVQRPIAAGSATDLPAFEPTDRSPVTAGAADASAAPLLGAAPLDPAAGAARSERVAEPAAAPATAPASFDLARPSAAIPALLGSASRQAALLAAPSTTGQVSIGAPPAPLSGAPLQRFASPVPTPTAPPARSGAVPDAPGSPPLPRPTLGVGQSAPDDGPLMGGAPAHRGSQAKSDLPPLGLSPAEVGSHLPYELPLLAAPSGPLMAEPTIPSAAPAPLQRAAATMPLLGATSGVASAPQVKAVSGVVARWPVSRSTDGEGGRTTDYRTGFGLQSVDASTNVDAGTAADRVPSLGPVTTGAPSGPGGYTFNPLPATSIQRAASSATPGGLAAASPAADPGVEAGWTVAPRVAAPERTAPPAQTVPIAMQRVPEAWASPTSLQRDDAVASPAAPGPPIAAPTAGPAPAAPGGADAGGGDADLDDLSRRIYERIAARMKTELYLDRERAGLLTDLST
jgi:hypothetical protein